MATIDMASPSRRRARHRRRACGGRGRVFPRRDRARRRILASSHDASRSAMSHLFDPFRIGELELANRIVIAPMCQYSASDGSAGDWHLIHLGHLALSGAGMLIVEATAVSPEGRITATDLGLYSDANEAALARVLAAARANSPIAIGMQLAHAGRKGSSRAPWEGGAQVP